jgi:hypothetical protein
MRQLIIVFATLFVTSVACAQSNEAKIWERVEALHKAIFQDKDSVALMDLVGSKVTYGHSNGNVEDKAAMVRNAVANQTTYKSPVTERENITFLNKTAIVRANLRGTSVEKGVEAPLNLGILQVWTKENGKWRIQARQAVKINPK